MGNIVIINGYDECVNQHEVLNDKKQNQYFVDAPRAIGLFQNAPYVLDLDFQYKDKVTNIEILNENKDIICSFENGKKSIKIENDNFPKKLCFKANQLTTLTFIRIRCDYLEGELVEQIDYDLSVVCCLLADSVDEFKRKQFSVADKLKNQSIEIDILPDKTKYSVEENARIQFNAGGEWYNDYYGYNDNRKVNSFILKYEIKLKIKKILFANGRSDFNYEGTILRFRKYFDNKVNESSDWANPNNEQMQLMFMQPLENNSNFDICNFSGFSKADNLKLKLERFAGGFCAFWLKQENAASYTVEVFKSYDSYTHGRHVGEMHTISWDEGNDSIVYCTDVNSPIENIQCMYKTIIEKEQCYYSLSGLSCGDYLMRITAESRDGQTLAVSYTEHIEI